MKIFLITSMIAVLSVASASAATPDASGMAFFESKVRPLLKARCYECHSAESGEGKGGLYLDYRAGWETGGDSGPAVVPGDLDKSLIISAVRYLDDDFAMPPKQKLSDSEIAILEQWVRLGAPDPREMTGPALAGREIYIDQRRKFWAFQPVRNPPVPEVRQSDRPLGDVDRFLLARLEQEGLAPVADADSRTLVRRATLDLTGLPPTPEETAAFVAAADRDRQSALSELIDRLLSSPRFGERWGQHWLDVARFSESAGANWNVPYPGAWRYRDYVIASLNADKPYDRFVREQLAGDLLPAGNQAQRDEQRIATGFLALGLKDLMEKDDVKFAMDIVDEQIDTTGRALLGLTIACARCHDHKFDPIRTEDYYALAGIFRSTEPLSGALRLRNSRTHATRLYAVGDAPQAMSETDRDAFTKQVAAAVKLSLKLREARQVLDANQRRRSQGEKLASSADEDAAAVRQLDEELDTVLLRLEELRQQAIASLEYAAPGVRDMAKPADTTIFIRGEADKPGAIVPRGFPAVLCEPGESAALEKPAGSGRLELAEWLTRPEHPLTARVLVNRVWLHLFGAGLVESVDNFGETGQAPSHPELLDHLAARFVARGWSVKTLIRELMLTRAYQLGSDHDETAWQADPANRLLWRASRRRLSAEAIRDSLLFVCGALDERPPVGSPVTPFNYAQEWTKVKGLFNFARLNPETLSSSGLLEHDVRYRSIYLPTIRGGMIEARELFDAASPDESTGRRAVTTVPGQALYFLNSPLVRRCADDLAALIRRSAPEDAGRQVELAFARTLARPPTADERLVCLQLLESQSLTAVCQSLFASGEFRTVY